jgi:Arc/MetJ-type ribon-helix-helix transcriptional regulator
MHRAQILIDPEQHTALANLAQKENRSISDLVREIVQEYLDQQNRKTRLQRELQALEALSQLRRVIQEEKGIYAGDLIEESRHERDEDVDRVWRGEP